MLGDEIRKKRKSENLTVSALADKVGVSESYISQLERGLVDPSVSLLRRLAFALNVPVGAFFEDEGAEPIITRLNEREEISTEDGSVSFSWISPEADDLQMEMVEIEIAAGKTVNAPKNSRHVCLFITESSLSVRYQDTDSALSSGDSIFIPSNTEYSLTNSSGAPAKGIICTAKGGSL